MIRKLYLILSFILLGNISFSQETNYIKQAEYKSLKISLADFKKIIASIEYYNSQNSKDTSDKDDLPRIKLEINKSDKSISATSFKQIAELNISNENFTTLNFYYYWDKKALSDLTIRFENYKRTISISGNDQRKVDAVFAEIDKLIKGNESSFSWIKSPFLIYFISILLISFIVFLILEKLTKAKERTSDLYSVSWYMGCLVTVLLIMLMPFSIESIFPNFLLTYNDVSWIDKNANLLGFIGFFITIVTILYNFIKWLRVKTKLAD